MHRNHERSSRRPWLGTLVLLPALASWRALPQDGSEKVEEARATLEKMMDARRLISQERSDWAVGREMLQERINVVQHEIESLREKLAGVRENIADADKKRAELLAEKELHAQASRSVGNIVEDLESRTRVLLRRLPDPLRERVRPLSQRLPIDPAESKETLSARFQNVVGILDQADKFNREITVVSEVRTLTGGASAEVTAMYLGLGQAFYSTAAADAAGVGGAAGDTWTWTPADASARDVARAIAIWKNEGETADFVRLPVRVQ